MKVPEFAVIGTGRSGSGYMSNLLTANGLPCGHERYFRPISEDREPFEYVGDSSWLALPYIKDGSWGGTAIHITRDPVAVVGSLVGIGFFSDQERQEAYPSFAYTNLPSLGSHNTQVQRAVHLWIEWNRRCAKVADVTMRLEDLDYSRLSDILCHEIKPRPELDTRYNHRAHESVPAAAIRQLLSGAEKEFGY